MTIRFTHEAALKGYSFAAGDIQSFPDHVGEQIIADGVAYRVPSSENAMDRIATDALKEAKGRTNGRS